VNAVFNQTEKLVLSVSTQAVADIYIKARTSLQLGI